MDLLILVGLACIILMPVVSAVTFFVKRTRKFSIITFLTAGFLLTLFIPSILIGDYLRIKGFYLAAERAEPLVQAVESYRKQKGKLPASLESLVPDYLEKIPYGIPPLKLEAKKGNSWTLTADVGTGVLNWDEFQYASDGDYLSYGSSMKRIGKWAYFFE